MLLIAILNQMFSLISTVPLTSFLSHSSSSHTAVLFHSILSLHISRTDRQEQDDYFTPLKGIHGGLTMKAATEWTERFTVGTPLKSFLYVTSLSQVLNLHRYSHIQTCAGKVIEAITGFLPRTPCCCTLSSLVFSIVILSSFLSISRFASH